MLVFVVATRIYRICQSKWSTL